MNKTPPIQLERVRDWERRNPERAQARKNRWWATAKGKAAAKRRQAAHNAYRKAWRDRKRAAAKAEASAAGTPTPPA